MNSRKLKMALLNIGVKNNEKKILGNKSFKNSYGRNNKLFHSPSFNNKSINSSYSLQKKFSRVMISPNKYSNLNIDNYQIDNENLDTLKENLIKSKEKYNEKNRELYNLKLKYNKLNKYNRDNLQLLYTIMNKMGISPNKADNVNKMNISQIIKKEEQEALKGKHLISCFKYKILEYQTKIDEKENKLSKIMNSSRINKLTKLESDNASKVLENINLTIEKDKLSNKISTMETAMNSLHNKCYRLRRSANKNMSNIGILMNKIDNLTLDLKVKDHIIENLKRKNKVIKEDSITDNKNERILVIKSEIKKNLKQKEKEIKIIEEKIKDNDEKLINLSQEKNRENEDDIEYIKKMNNIYKQNEQIYKNKIELLIGKISVLEEKNNLINEIL